MVAKKAKWQGLNDVRASYRSADMVKVKSKKQVLVFNIGGNQFRLIIAAHFDRQNLYILRFMTHAEYNKNNWKEEL